MSALGGQLPRALLLPAVLAVETRVAARVVRLLLPQFRRREALLDRHVRASAPEEFAQDRGALLALVRRVAAVTAPLSLPLRLGLRRGLIESFAPGLEEIHLISLRYKLYNSHLCNSDL